MKNEYICPDLEIVIFEPEDIITASSGSVPNSFEANTWIEI